jgi:uncharacterized protein (UPF0332 family)
MVEKRELVEACILMVEEKLGAFLDDYRAQRWNNATTNLYFALENLVRALLSSVGIESRSHEGIRILFSMHFIKKGDIHPRIGRYLGNLYDRRVTAEYSPLRRSEFNKEEIDTYLQWVRESADEILPILKENNINTTTIESLLSNS